MGICNGCSGVVGGDCFNPQECEWISRDMEASANAQRHSQGLQEQIDELRAIVIALADQIVKGGE